MKPSPRIVLFMKGYEKLRLHSYMPTTHDRPTIGWGSTGPDIKMGMTWTPAQCDARFEADLDHFSSSIEHLLVGCPTSQCQFDALVSLTYNIGLGNITTSTLLRKHKAGDFAGAGIEFVKWDEQAHTVLNGLLIRREAEAKIYESH